MSKKIDKIKASKIDGTLLKTSKVFDVKNEKVSFSFENFNPDSVIEKSISYNSYYQNIESSKNAVSDFFEKAKELSRFKIGELMSDRCLKENLHLDKICIDEHIDRIETVLKKCYNYPLGKIEQFDREYYEYQISDGKRVIWYIVDNMICPLFIDCNHMICIESSKNIKAKMDYSIKSSFSHHSNDDLNEVDSNIKSTIEIILSSYENGELLSSEDIIDLLKDAINYP